MTKDAWQRIRGLDRRTRREVLLHAWKGTIPISQDGVSTSGSGQYKIEELETAALLGENIIARTMTVSPESGGHAVEAGVNFDIWTALAALAEKYGVTVLSPLGHNKTTVFLPYVSGASVESHHLSSADFDSFQEFLEEKALQVHQDFAPFVRRYMESLGAIKLEQNPSNPLLQTYQRNGRKLYVRLDFAPRNFRFPEKVPGKRPLESTDHFMKRLLAAGVCIDPLYLAYGRS